VPTTATDLLSSSLSAPRTQRISGRSYTRRRFRGYASSSTVRRICLQPPTPRARGQPRQAWPHGSLKQPHRGSAAWFPRRPQGGDGSPCSSRSSAARRGLARRWSRRRAAVSLLVLIEQPMLSRREDGSFGSTRPFEDLSRSRGPDPDAAQRTSRRAVSSPLAPSGCVQQRLAKPKADRGHRVRQILLHARGIE